MQGSWSTQPSRMSETFIGFGPCPCVLNVGLGVRVSRERRGRTELQRCSQPAPNVALVVGELAAELFAEDALLGNDLEAGDHQDEEWWAKKGQGSGEVNRLPEENEHKAQVHGVAGVAVNAGDCSSDTEAQRPFNVFTQSPKATADGERPEGRTHAKAAESAKGRQLVQ